MRSEIKTFSYPSGDIQRVQLVRLENWQQLEFLKLNYASQALNCFADIYRRYLVPACPWLFGNMVMFHLPEDMKGRFSFASPKYGALSDDLTAAAAALEQGVRFRGKTPKFADAEIADFWNELVRRGELQVVRGKLPITTVIPVGDAPGYLTEAEPDARLKVNSSFFIMDRFDCATVYDHVGTHLGLCVKDGVVENPPLFCREALLVKRDGTVSIESPDLRQMEIEINGAVFRHGANAILYSRPERSRTPRCDGKKLVIIGRRVAAVHMGSSVPIPASGFVLRVDETCSVNPGDMVTYRGMEDVQFGIQVGNSIVKNGVRTERFISRFYNIRHLEPVPFPPSLYPMDFRRARAARIALGADKNGTPMLLWAEGAAKLGHVPGQGSCGASLSEMADICSELGMVNAVNLDGGGSAQILLGGKRSLKISDRNPGDYSEAERPVPIGLMVK